MHKMPQLSYITTCKGRLSHLQQTLPRVAQQPNVECIVVDYGCPEQCGDWVAANYPGVKVVRVGPTQTFNASRARNAGAAVATAPWLGFFDADILLEPDFSVRVMPELKPGNFYRAHPVTYQTWGSIICQRDDFSRVGGYDECYSGWGGEDDDLVRFLLLQNVQQVGFPAKLLSEIGHSDEMRTQFCEIEDRWLQSRINQLYLAAKTDLFLMRKVNLSTEESAALYKSVYDTLSQKNSLNDSRRTIQVNLTPTLLGSPPIGDQFQVSELQKTITYSLRIMGSFPNPGIPPSSIDCIFVD